MINWLFPKTSIYERLNQPRPVPPDLITTIWKKSLFGMVFFPLFVTLFDWMWPPDNYFTLEYWIKLITIGLIMGVIIGALDCRHIYKNFLNGFNYSHK
ncbi:MAG: hypothetical protein K9N11_09025 [Lentisphaeria bacterium]|nr:hypothetical protein [Candidatus Neomarinimicrobiota bacterium]MCF7842980.1 hypothetical protein [Lentisphaeria bacterium]